MTHCKPASTAARIGRSFRAHAGACDNPQLSRDVAHKLRPLDPNPTTRSMAHRQFTDSAGQTWDVWDVHPTTASRTLAQLYPHQPPGAETPCHAVAPGRADGWLCCGGGAERRRLVPVPANWETLAPAELERLRDCAARVPRPGEKGRPVLEVAPQAQRA